MLDLANFEQILWNTSHGRWFALSTRPWTDSYLGDHFSLILILPSLLYRIFPFTETILLGQTAVIALSGYLVYLIAKNFSYSEKQSLMFTAVFLTFPALGLINLFDAHANIFAIPISLACLYFYQTKRFNLLTIFLILLITVKEDLAIAVFSFGLVLLFTRQKRERYFGIFAIFLSLAWFYAAIKIMIPYFTITNRYQYVLQYSYLGFGQNLKGFSLIATLPLIIKSLISFKKLVYFSALMGPLLFIPCAGGRWFLPVIIIITPVLLNINTDINTIKYQYAANFIAFIFFALMEGTAWLNRKFKLKIEKILYTILLFQIILIILGVINYLKIDKSCKFHVCYGDREYPMITIDNTLKKIPVNSSLAVSNNIGSHLARREGLYIFPRISKAQYVLIDKSKFGTWHSLELENEVFSDLKTSGLYKEVFSKEQIYLFERIAN